MAGSKRVEAGRSFHSLCGCGDLAPFAWPSGLAKGCPTGVGTGPMTVKKGSWGVSRTTVSAVMVIDIDVKSSIVNLHFTEHPRSESLARRLNLCVNTWVKSSAATALTGATITMQ